MYDAIKSIVPNLIVVAMSQYGSYIDTYYNTVLCCTITINRFLLNRGTGILTSKSQTGHRDMSKDRQHSGHGI